jgi:hypothetical protein
MACITVPIAVRLATFTSLTAMNADRIRIECILQNDARLLEGIPVIVSHAAENAGIPEKAREVLASEALEACRRALASVENERADSSILLLVDQYQDRAEVIVEYNRKDIFDSHAGRNGASHRADHAQHESSEGRSRVKLVRYCGALDPKQTK